MTGVSVDDDFARFGAKSYAINKINSVEVREIKPNSLGCAYALILVAAVCAFAAFGAFLGGDGSGAVASLVFAAIIALPAWLMWQRAQIREYHLFLMTSSSETQAYITRDQDEVLSLREQIESAMLRHSRAGSDR